MQAYTIDQVKSVLSNGLSNVTFYKLDGTLREMVATRDPSIIPRDKQKSKGNKSESSDVVTVYDVEVDGWRSFVLTNLVSIDRQ